MKLLLSALLALTLITAAGARATDAAATIGTTTAAPAARTVTPASDTVMAKGNGFEIRWKQIDQVLATAKAQNPKDELPPDAEFRIATQLIEIQLVLQKATDAEKAVGKKEADDRVAAIRKIMSPAEFEQRLQDTHMTEADLGLKFAEDATAQASLTRQLGIAVTDADAKKFFDAHPGAYDQPVTARIRELVLLTTSDFTTSAAPPLPAAIIQAKRKLIDSLLKRIRAGDDFTALVKQYNEDPISKDTDGVLAFRKEQMEFGEQAFAMKPNQISDVLTNDEGFRIIQLLEITPAKKAVFADLDDRLKTMLIGKQKREQAPAYINQLRKDAGVEILDSKLKADQAASEAQATEAAKLQAEYAAKQAASEAAASATPAKP